MTQPGVGGWPGIIAGAPFRSKADMIPILGLVGAVTSAIALDK